MLRWPMSTQNTITSQILNISFKSLLSMDSPENNWLLKIELWLSNICKSTFWEGRDFSWTVWCFGRPEPQSNYQLWMVVLILNEKERHIFLLRKQNQIIRNSATDDCICDENFNEKAFDSISFNFWPTC